MKRKMKIILSLLLAVMLLVVSAPDMVSCAKVKKDYITNIENITPTVMYTVEKTVAYFEDLQTIAIPAFPSGTALQVTAICETNYYHTLYQVNFGGQSFYIEKGLLVDFLTFEPMTMSFVSSKTGKTESFRITDISSAQMAAKALINDGNDGSFTVSPQIIQNQFKMYDIFRAYTLSPLTDYNEFTSRGGSTYAIGRLNTSEEEMLLEQKVSEICTSFNYTSEYEAVKMAHDWICNNTDYAYMDGYWDESYCDPYQALFEKKSICQGYATLFQKFMDTMGINSYIAKGYAPGTSASFGTMSHVWNIVQIDGQWYHIDCTWDGQTSRTTYNYFLKGSDSVWYTSIGNVTLSPTDYR